MKTLLLDIETYSNTDLAKCGVDRYCEEEGFALLLFAYSVDYGPVEIIDVASGEKIPDEIISALSDDNVIKWAHNARFERACLSCYLGTYLDPKSWRCSMVACAYLGLPFSLEAAAHVSGAESQKMDEGQALIRYFSKPPRHYPWDDPVKWETFKEYCVRDVETEMAILDRIKKHPVPEVEWANYVIDQRINDRGIMIDRELVANALVADAVSSAALTDELKTLTGLQNPNSPAQIKGWLGRNGVQTDSIDKRFVKEMIPYADDKVKQVLGLRQELAKSSVSKYKRMEQVVCEDNRMRGLFQFYGASRTGRSAGRLVNGQNLPSSHLPNLDELRRLLKDGDYSKFAGKCESVPTALSELIRTTFIPAPGYKFICVDFSSIERVVLAWLAGEEWVLQAYAAKKDLYAATASQMFHVPIEQIAKGSEFRQKGKIGDLACIAQGELVLTDQGLTPIEGVTQKHKLWDGESWVEHNGIVNRGIRKVLEYDGLRATPDHLVWVEGEEEPLYFGDAAACGAHLIQTGDGGRPIRLGEEKKLAVYLGKTQVYDIRNAGSYNRFTVSGKLVHNCGYGGGVNALKKMGAVDMGIHEDELQGIVNAWRSANPRIVKLWRDVDKAVKHTIRNKSFFDLGRLNFDYRGGMLAIRLPSGRRLHYIKPRIETGKNGYEQITFEGDAHVWTRQETYGAKIVENITQAIARDVLFDAMRRLEAAGLEIVLHCHDEIVRPDRAQ